MSSQWLDRGGTAQVGGSPLSHIVFLVSLPLFSLTPSAQRKKLSKKETPKNYFAICGWRPPLRALDRRSLFEKSDVKTFNKLTDKPQFIITLFSKIRGKVIAPRGSLIYAQLIVVGFSSLIIIPFRNSTALRRPSSMVITLSSCSIERTLS